MIQPDPESAAHAYFQLPVSAPFLRTVIAALVDGRLVDASTPARILKNWRRPRSILPTGAPDAWRGNLSR